MQMQPPSTNGNHTAPRAAHGAVAVPAPSMLPQPVTSFPRALPYGGSDELLYTLGRGTFLGLPLLRVITLVVAFVALTWALRPLPGGGWVSSALLAGLAGIAIARSAAGRRAFVHFSDGPDIGNVEATALPASEKLPIYLWGKLEVQGRVRSFVALPGFYRTFATREHALIGRVVSHARLGVARLSDLDEGLWYAFCAPDQVISLRVGSVRWGRQRYPALALERRSARVHENGRTHTSVEILYIGSQERATIERILADLAVERKAPANHDALHV